MGQPAARVGINTGAHSAPILPPGSLNVLINGFPSARQGDKIIYPAFPSHPPAKITGGSTTAFINGLSAARMCDITACGAPPLPPIEGPPADQGGVCGGINSPALDEKIDDNIVAEETVAYDIKDATLTPAGTKEISESGSLNVLTASFASDDNSFQTDASLLMAEMKKSMKSGDFSIAGAKSREMTFEKESIQTDSLHFFITHLKEGNNGIINAYFYQSNAIKKYEDVVDMYFERLNNINSYKTELKPFEACEPNKIKNPKIHSLYKTSGALKNDEINFQVHVQIAVMKTSNGWYYFELVGSMNNLDNNNWEINKRCLEMIIKSLIISLSMRMRSMKMSIMMMMKLFISCKQLKNRTLI